MKWSKLLIVPLVMLVYLPAAAEHADGENRPTAIVPFELLRYMNIQITDQQLRPSTELILLLALDDDEQKSVSAILRDAQKHFNRTIVESMKVDICRKDKLVFRLPIPNEGWYVPAEDARVALAHLLGEERSAVLTRLLCYERGSMMINERNINDPERLAEVHMHQMANEQMATLLSFVPDRFEPSTSKVRITIERSDSDDDDQKAIWHVEKESMRGQRNQFMRNYRMEISGPMLTQVESLWRLAFERFGVIEEAAHQAD